VTQIESFRYGFAFAFGMALIRYLLSGLIFGDFSPPIHGRETHHYVFLA